MIKQAGRRGVITMECLGSPFFAPPPQCSKERTLKNDAYLLPNLGQYFHGSENIKARNKKNEQMVSFRELFCVSAVGCN